MLNKDDRNKIAIMAAIGEGLSDDELLDKFHLSSGTLAAIKSEYELIKSQLTDMKAVTEIAEGMDCPEEFVEEVSRIISGEITPPKEGDGDDEPPKDTKKPKKKGKGKDIDDSLKITGEEQAASVLVSDAGEISRDVATRRQEIGRFVMEEMGTVAMQFGYLDHKAFLQMIYDFWLNNYGKIQERDQQIAELLDVNGQLQAVVDQDILKLFIAKSLDRVVIAALMGGGTLDADTLQAYKRILETVNPSKIIQSGDAQVYAE